MLSIKIGLNMKEYCVDLEIAEELQENNFPQTFFGWYKPNYDGRDRKPVLLEVLANGTSTSSFNGLSQYRLTYAPTSDEILKELPSKIEEYFLDILKLQIEYTVGYSNMKPYEQSDFIWLTFYNNKKISVALAKLWLHCKKEGYIK